MMLNLIEDLPSDVIGIEASGRVTHQDYQSVLIPRAKAAMATGRVNMLYVFGKDFTGFDLEALWDDGAFGVKHWRDFERIAVVADLAWLRAAISMFRPFFPAEVRLFGLPELAAAKTWVAGAKTPSP